MIPIICMLDLESSWCLYSCYETEISANFSFDVFKRTPIAEAEKMTASAEEINVEIDRMIKNNNNQQQVEDLKKLFNLPQARKSIENLLISKKTMERLKEIASDSPQPAKE